MWAMVKETLGDGIVYKEVETPIITEYEVLVKVRATGICGSDLPIISGVRKVQLPLIPGHEFSGDIVKLGSGVKNFKVGDRVTSSIVINCGTCYYCMNDLDSLCDELTEIGIHRDGSFAEYVSVPESTLVKLPDEITYIEAASLDPLASAYHGIMKADIDKKDLAIIFGPGPIGLYCVQLLKLIGFEKVILVGIKSNANRLRVGLELGADTMVLSDENELMSKFISETHNKLADIVVDATGSTISFNHRLHFLRKHGTFILLGIANKNYNIDLDTVIRNEIILKGSLCYSKNDFLKCMNLVLEKKIKVDPIISHKLTLEEFNYGIEVINRHEAIKVMFEI